MKGNEFESRSNTATVDVDENEARLVGDLVREIMDRQFPCDPAAGPPPVGGNDGAGLSGEDRTSPARARFGWAPGTHAANSAGKRLSHADTGCLDKPIEYAISSIEQPLRFMTTMRRNLRPSIDRCVVLGTTSEASHASYSSTGGGAAL